MYTSAYRNVRFNRVKQLHNNLSINVYQGTVVQVQTQGKSSKNCVHSPVSFQDSRISERHLNMRSLHHATRHKKATTSDSKNKPYNYSAELKAQCFRCSGCTVALDNRDPDTIAFQAHTDTSPAH
ncbi:unnamed protein product [Colias eurytheme]|nr:unnamed protein product [Colias eurytheme]